MKLDLKLVWGAEVWLVKKNFKTLFLYSLFNGGVYLLYDTLSSALYSAAKGPASSHTLWLVSAFMGFTVGAQLLAYVGSTLGYALVIVNMMSKDMSPPIPLAKQIRYVMSRFFAMCGTTILYGCAIGLGSILLVVPGIIWAMKYSQALNCTLIDGDSPFAAFRNSAKITKGNYMRISVFSTLLSLLYALVLIPVLLFPFPQFIKIVFYSFSFILSTVQNYVIWKILKQNYAYNASVPIAGMSKSKKILLIFLTLLVLVMGIVALRTLFSANRKFNSTLLVPSGIKSQVPTSIPSPEATAIPVPTETPFPTPTGIETLSTDDWRTYSNKTYKYTLEHPPAFIAQALDDTSNAAKSGNVAIRSVDGQQYITLTPESGTVEEKMRKYGPLMLELSTSFHDHEVSVMTQETEAGGIPRYIAFVDMDGANVLVVQLGPIPQGKETEYKKFFLTILSTISFK